MFSRILLGAALTSVFALSVGCSGSSGGGTTTGGTTTGGTTTGGTTTGGTTTGGTTTGGNGTTSGVWFGPSSSGEAVFVVDGAEQVVGLFNNGSGEYQTVFGALSAGSGTVERFFHRNSDNPSYGDSFTLAGDVRASDEFSAVSLQVANDGQQLNNTGGSMPFSLTFATSSDVQAISVADMVGTWKATSSFCTEATGVCTLDFTMTVAANGSVTGFTELTYLDTIVDPIPLTGTISAAGDSTQYLNFSFAWNTTNRTGVIYQNRDSAQVVFNTYGVEGGSTANSNGNSSLSGLLTRQP